MHIEAVSSNNQNFKARIKLNKPKLEVLAQSAIGATALATGAATIADGVLSVYATNENQPIESIPKAVIESHRNILLEDNDGRGLPVLTTSGPMIMSGAGGYVSAGASNAFENAFGEDNIEASTAIPLDSSKAVSANKFVQNSALGTTYFGTAAASLYSAAYPEEVVPESANINDENLEISQESSLVTGGLGASVPVALGSGGLASMASDTKSSQFVADTLTEPKSDKKIPS